MAGALTVYLPDMASPRSGDWLGSDALWIAWAITRNQLDLRRLMWNIVIARGRAAMTPLEPRASLPSLDHQATVAMRQYWT
jgi:hypothetical protein